MEKQVQEIKIANSRKRGSWFWLLFWLIMFWPIAIVYALSRRWR